MSFFIIFAVMSFSCSDEFLISFLYKQKQFWMGNWMSLNCFDCRVYEATFRGTLINKVFEKFNTLSWRYCCSMNSWVNSSKSGQDVRLSITWSLSNSKRTTIVVIFRHMIQAYNRHDTYKFLLSTFATKA